MGNRTGVAHFFMMFALVFSSVEVWGAGNVVPNGPKCNNPEIKQISDLDFVGLKFDAQGSFCVDAPSESSALQYCSSRRMMLINPENPQYSNKAQGSTNNNPLNYYYCVKSTLLNKKEHLCNVVAPKSRIDLKFRWKKTSANDGDCFCGPDGQEMRNCDQKLPSQGETPDLKKKCVEELLGVYESGDTGISCFCRDEKGNKDGSVDINGSVKCETKKSATAKSPGADEKVDGITKALKECVDQKVNETSLCQSTGKAAFKSCNTADKTNPYVAEALKVPDLLSDVFIKSNTGKGMTGSCFKAAVASRSTKYALQDMSEDCKKNIDECTAACNLKEKLKEYEEQCEKLGQAGVSDSEDEKYYVNNREDLESKINEFAPKCTGEAKKKYDTLEYFMGSLANSFKAGMLCACQAASSAIGQSGTACNSIPTEAQCLANPALAGCYVYDAADICSPRSSKFNQQGCACQSNPQGPGCPAFVQANPNNSGFAGPDIKLPSGGGASTSPTAGFGGASSGGAGGGFGADGLDLNPQKPDELANVGKPNVGGPGFLGGAGGGGGGGGGSGGGGGGGSAEQPNRDADGGPAASSGGVFGQAKSFMGSLFGGNKNNANNAGRGATGNLKVNTDQFKPKGMRGVAGYEGVGSKNMDIWQMMFNRYDENHNTFILTP